jgi:hypothetical protein
MYHRRLWPIEDKEHHNRHNATVTLMLAMFFMHIFSILNELVLYLRYFQEAFEAPVVFQLPFDAPFFFSSFFLSMLLVKAE